MADAGPGGSSNIGARHPRHRWFAALPIISGVMLVQLAWAWLIPPFGNMDEFDHAYRAASVARGHLTDREPAENGRGDLIRVPPDLVIAAYHQCSNLQYTKWQNCNPASSADSSGEVLVASAAARYNPVYYEVVGRVALPFHGTGALLAMRAATALLCDALLLIALLIALRTAKTLWPVTGLLVASTPVLLCASTTVAPNGVQMTAGLLAWTAGLALWTDPWMPLAQQRRLMITTAVALCVVITTHSTGPMWALLTIIGIAGLFGRKRLVRLCRGLTRTLVVAAALVGGTAAASLLWVLTQSTNTPSQDSGHFGSMPLGQTLQQPFLWVFQTVGAVPFRNQPAPTSVFAIGLVTFGLMFGAGLVFAARRERLVLLAISFLSLAIPMVLTVSTFSSLGFAWQGRYTLAFAFGLPVICTWVLDRTPRLDPWAAAGAGVAAIGFGATEVLTLVHVRNAYIAPNWSPLDHLAVPGQALMIALPTASILFVLTAFTLWERASSEDRLVRRSQPPRP